METKSLIDPRDTQTTTPDTKLEWEKPSFNEADITGVTQSAGFGGNDGVGSHS